MEIKKEKFKNRKKTKITIVYTNDYPRYDIATISVVAKVGRSYRRSYVGESMLILLGTLKCSFSDYKIILKEVLHKDKVARRWFRKKVGDIVVDPVDGTRLSAFFRKSEEIDMGKVDEYDRKINQIKKDNLNKQLKSDYDNITKK